MVAEEEGFERPSEQQGTATGERIREQFELLTFSAVTAAALLDGINPCAIATLIFFLSVMSGLGMLKRKLLIVGVSFCAAVFITYFLIGLGLLEMLHVFSGRLVIRRIIYSIVVAVLLVFSFYSFYDAWIYRKYGESRRIKLQLPLKIKQRIHATIRKNMGTGSLALGSFVTGVIVSVLESVCTGQVYLPTIVFIATDEMRLAAWGYLFWYNILFVLPLLIILLLAYKGMTSQVIARFSQKNLTFVKVGLGVFFIGLATLMTYNLVSKLGA
jgi:cytochrome c biogenesis protein CcdA